MAQRVAVGPDVGLGQQRQLLQIREAMHRRRIEARRAELVPVVRHMLRNITQQRAQAVELQRAKPVGGPPLRVF